MGSLSMWDKEKHRSIGDRELRPETLMLGYGYRQWLFAILIAKKPGL